MNLTDEILGVEDMVVPFKAPNARAIRRWALQQGKLPPGKKVGNEIVWVKAEVLEWISAGRAKTVDEFNEVEASLAAGLKRETTKKRKPGRPKKLGQFGLLGAAL